MRDIVGDFLEAAHQRFDALQHDVEIDRQAVQLVVAAADRQPLGKIARHDRARGFRHGIDPREHTACNKETAGEAQHDDDRDRPLARGTDDVEKPFAFFQVTADQQAETAGELEHPHQRVMLGAVRIVEPAIHGFCPARRFHHAFGERTDVASQALAVEGGDEIEA